MSHLMDVLGKGKQRDGSGLCKCLTGLRSFFETIGEAIVLNVLGYQCWVLCWGKCGYSPLQGNQP